MRILKKLIPYFIFMLPIITLANIYEYKDQQGNTVFSNRPPMNSLPSQQIKNLSHPNKMNPAQTISAQIQLNSLKTEQSNQFAIVSPTQHQTFWNEKQISVDISVAAILIASGSIQLRLDGKIYQQPQSKTKFFLENIARGSHTVQAQLLNVQGEAIKTTQTITFFVHYSSTLNETK